MCWTCKPPAATVTCRANCRPAPTSRNCAWGEGAAPVASIRCVTPPTHTIRPPLRNRAHWRLLSHLNLNHLSLSGASGTDALKEILRLYDFRDSDTTRKMIESICQLHT